MEEGLNSNTEMYVLFLQSCVIIFEKVIKNLEKDELIVPSCLPLYLGCNENSHSQKNDSILKIGLL